MPSTKEIEKILNELITMYPIANDDDKKIVEQKIRNQLTARIGNEQLNLYGHLRNRLLLKNIDLSNLDLSNIIFSDIDFENANFEKSDLAGTSFAGRDNKNLNTLINSNFRGSKCNKTSFNNVDMRGSTFDDSTTITEPNFENAWICRKILKFLIPKALYLNDSHNRQAINLKKISFTDENLQGVNFSGLYLNDCYFKGANLSGVLFKNTDIKGSYFSGAKNISDGQFSHAVNVKNAHFDTSVKNKQDIHKRSISGTAMITNYFKLKTQDDDEKLTQNGSNKRYKIDPAQKI